MNARHSARHHRARSIVLISCVILPACARYREPATWALESSPEKVRSSRAPTTMLERREIASFDDRSLADAVEQLRPDWLRPGPTTRIDGESPSAALYVNDVPSGDVSGLRAIPTATTIDVRLLSASEAWARFGPSCRCPAGALLVRTRVNE